jgi:hypothetical protein
MHADPYHLVMDGRRIGVFGVLPFLEFTTVYPNPYPYLYSKKLESLYPEGSLNHSFTHVQLLSSEWTKMSSVWNG